MDKYYARKLVREALADPQLLFRRKKFWRVGFFDYYLDQCTEWVLETPARAVDFAEHGPQLAERVAANNPEASGADLLLRAHATLGYARQTLGDHTRAEEAFAEARKHEHQSSPQVQAYLYRRLAYFRLFQKQPECFRLVEEAIAISKRGNLVDRNEFGKNLLCRGHAYFEFNDPGRSLEDLSAALNHISIEKEPRTYYWTLYNLSLWTVYHGDEDQLRSTLENLQAARKLLASYHKRSFAKYKLRWLIGLIESRLGRKGSALTIFLEVRTGLEDLQMPYEYAMVSIDIGLTYLHLGDITRVRRTAERATEIFQRIGVEAKVLDALELVRRTDEKGLTAEYLNEIRDQLVQFTEPMPASSSPVAASP